jgi:hypothetical protein
LYAEQAPRSALSASGIAALNAGRRPFRTVREPRLRVGFVIAFVVGVSAIPVPGLHLLA